MIQKRFLMVAALGCFSFAVPVDSYSANDVQRMEPAQRLFVDGAVPSDRDKARSSEVRAQAVDRRGSSYDEMLSERVAERRAVRATPAGRNPERKVRINEKRMTGKSLSWETIRK